MVCRWKSKTHSRCPKCSILVIEGDWVKLDKDGKVLACICTIAVKEQGREIELDEIKKYGRIQS